MRKKSKVTVSQILLCVAILALLGAFFIVAVVSEHAPVFAAMKEKGMAAEATVTGKEIRVKEGTTRKGRKSQTTSHFLKVAYDSQSVTPHAEAAAGHAIKPSPHPSVINSEVQVSTAEYESMEPGGKTMVTYLPGKVFELKLTASVRDYSPVWQILTAVILFLLGAGSAVLSWKRRQPKGPPPVPAMA